MGLAFQLGMPRCHLRGLQLLFLVDMQNGNLFDLTEDAKNLGWFDQLPDLEIKRCSYDGKLYAYPVNKI